MRFALLGDHPDGVEMARAMADSGRHELAVYHGPPVGLAALEHRGLRPRKVGDLEEVLADPAIDAVIVAGGPATRAGQPQHALQSERHVLCVHPADARADLAYEAAMLQADTGYVLLPLLCEAQHPGIRRWPELAGAVAPRLIEVERWSAEEILLEADPETAQPGLPGWDMLRLLGGELAEVFVLTSADELAAGQPLVLSGRYVSGVLLQASLLPNQAESRYRLSLVGGAGRVTLDFAHGWPGPAVLHTVDERGAPRQELWDALDPWAALVALFDDAVTAAAVRRRPTPAVPALESLTRPQRSLGWQDEVRALELDDAARRSVLRRRSSALDNIEATEEASFKGTMTLVGCSLLWLGLALLIASAWIPWLGWLIFPAFGLFLLLQGFRWIVPASPQGIGETGENGQNQQRPA